MKPVWSVEYWRGVAAVLVVWTHWAAALGQHQGLAAFAFTGVDIFFVISGFVFAPSCWAPSHRGCAATRCAGCYASTPHI